MPKQHSRERTKLLESTSSAANVLSKAVALRHQLDRRLQNLLEAVEHDGLSKASLLLNLQDAKKETLSLGAVFGKTLGPTIFASVLPSGSAFNVMKVFGIQELLELIAAHLTFGELCQLEMTSKEIRDALVNSTHLSHQFSFSPADDGTTRILCPNRSRVRHVEQSSSD